VNTAISNLLTGTFPTDDERSNVDLVVKEITPLIDTMKRSGKEPQIMVHLREAGAGLKELLKAQVQQQVSFLNETDINSNNLHPKKVFPMQLLEELWNPCGQRQRAEFTHKRSPRNSKGSEIPDRHPPAHNPGLWIVYLVAPLQIEEKRLEEIDRQIMSRKEEVKKVEALKKEIEALGGEIATINNFKENRRMSLDIIKELTAILPKTAWLSRVRVSETNVDLEGYASSASGLLSKLETSSFFKKVEFSSPTFRDTRMNADRFNIKMEIEGVDIEALKAEEETDDEEEE